MKKGVIAVFVVLISLYIVSMAVLWLNAEKEEEAVQTPGVQTVAAVEPAPEPVDYTEDINALTEQINSIISGKSG